MPFPNPDFEPPGEEEVIATKFLEYDTLVLSSHFSVSALCAAGVEVFREWGVKALRSKVPSWRCVTGILRGEISAVRTVERDVRAELMRASGAWKAGEREVIMEGVRRRMEGLGPSAVGVGAGDVPGLE